MKRSKNWGRLGVAMFGFVLVAGGSAALARQDVAVRGTVVDLSGKPLPSIDIQITDATGHREFVRTDRHGFFSAIGLVLGPVKLVEDQYGYLPEEITYGLKAGQSADCDFRLVRPLRVIMHVTSRPIGSDVHCELVPDPNGGYIVD